MKYSKFKDWVWYWYEKFISTFDRNRIVWRELPFCCRTTIWKLTISCKLWDLRGLPTCKKHGFHAQSWITGRCRKCDEENRKLESGAMVKRKWK